MRVLQRYPVTFWALTFVMIANCAIANAITYYGRIPNLSLFMPSVFIITTLCQVATCILLTVVFTKSRRWELQPLIILFLATALLHAAVFLTIRLPGRAVSLIAPGNAATPWLFIAVHASLSICAVCYAAARTLKSSMSPAQTLRAIRVLFPAWTALIIGAIIAIVVLNGHAPSGGSDQRMIGAERTVAFGVELLVSVIALALFFVYIERATLNWIDLSIALTMIAGVTGLLVNARMALRYSLPWVDAEVLYLFSGTFVLIAAIHDLVVRLGHSLRTESQALRLRVSAAEQNAEVEAALLKSRFVAMVSHELRTPLGGIIGMAELLERSRLSDEQLRYTNAIKTSAHGLHRIVTDLLDFSRAESGRIELEHEEFDLEQAVDDIVVLFRPQAREQGITIAAYIDPVLPRTIQGDQTRLKQVLQNLVSNAVRFTQAGGVRIEVLSGAVTGDHGVIKFLVSDTGVGIAPHSLERIFDAFVQEDASTARKFGGTGLGLAIVKHLVELMGGHIEVTSTVGAGTTFTFTLPARTVHTESSDLRSLRDITILVFDEDEDALCLLVRFVEGWCMQPIAVSSVERAHAALSERITSGRNFDLLLVGAGVSAHKASSFAKRFRSYAKAGVAAAVVIRDRGDEHADDVLADFDACVPAPVRQSALFDAIVRLRRDGYEASVVAPVQAAPARARRTERILVAEDNEVNQTLLVAQLDHLGFQADIVTDGESAVNAAISGTYDLIFMDCQMPGVDGFEATRLIRASHVADVPIIALTAHVLPGYRETCLAAGMTDYLAKPALLGPLTEMVDRWLPASGAGANTTASTTVNSSAQPFLVDASITLGAMKERLLDVFHGDVAQVERVIASSLASMRENVVKIETAIAEQNAADAKAHAHRLKGIALETGSPGLADHARDIERYVVEHEWTPAAESLRAFSAGLDAAVETNEVS